jgi:hypothetical protein
MAKASDRLTERARGKLAELLGGPVPEPDPQADVDEATIARYGQARGLGDLPDARSALAERLAAIARRREVRP